MQRRKHWSVRGDSKKRGLVDFPTSKSKRARERERERQREKKWLSILSPRAGPFSIFRGLFSCAESSKIIFNGREFEKEALRRNMSSMRTSRRTRISFVAERQKKKVHSITTTPKNEETKHTCSLSSPCSLLLHLSGGGRSRFPSIVILMGTRTTTPRRKVNKWRREFVLKKEKNAFFFFRKKSEAKRDRVNLCSLFFEVEKSSPSESRFFFFF